MIWIALAILVVGLLIVRAISEPEMRREREAIRQLEEQSHHEAEMKQYDDEIKGIKEYRKTKQQ
jgi:hypothetical protein